MNAQNKLSQFIDNARGLFDYSRELIIIKDTAFNYQACTLGICDFFHLRKDEVIGRSDYDPPWEKFADLYRKQDQKAMTVNRLDTIEPINVSKKIILAGKALRYPIRDEHNDIMGIFVQGIILPMDDIGIALSTVFLQDQKNLTYTGAIPKAYEINDYNANLKLTARENECLFLLIRGKSAKAMAQFLDISPRTVEVHIDHIKEKMNVSSRSEIIAKAIELNLFEIIPKSDVLVSLYTNAKKWKDFFA